MMDVKVINDRIATLRQEIALLNIELIHLERMKDTIPQSESTSLDTRKLLND